MFLEARGDAAELFELAEEPLNQVALAIEVGRNAALDAHAALGRDMRLIASLADQRDKGPAVKAPVGDDDAGWQTGLAPVILPSETEVEGQGGTGLAAALESSLAWRTLLSLWRISKSNKNN